MRSNTKERLNKKLAENKMATLSTESPVSTLKPEPVAATLNNVAIPLSDAQRELYDNYYTLQDPVDEELVVDSYPGHLQAIIQDDGKLFMVLLFGVGAFVIYHILQSQNKNCGGNNK